jgi:L-aspartate oxidase
VAIAWRAGATLSDLEFVQFHPTALYVKGAPRFLLSEALRGEGAQLRNIDLERFMPRYHEAAELAPRDIVSRAIVMEMHRCQSEFVYLDLTGLDPEHVKKRFPRIYSTCLEYNLDITADLMPVRPAAHYAMGGVATDLHGTTNLEGLYAAGEVAATGVHGANRLASNSLLEGLVYGAQAARAMSERRAATAAAHRENPAPTLLPASNPNGTNAVPDIENILSTVRNLAWEKVGIIRNGKDLSEAVKHLESLTLPPPSFPSRPYYEALNILEVARLIARSALAREESRGAHYRTDFPLKRETTPPRHSFVFRNSAVQFSSDLPRRAGSAVPRATSR